MTRSWKNASGVLEKLEKVLEIFVTKRVGTLLAMMQLALTIFLQKQYIQLQIVSMFWFDC